MTILGGYIHRQGIIKLGGGSSKLDFTPDRLIFQAGTESPRSTSSQYRRSTLLGNGGGSVGRTGDDTYYSSSMPEDGSFKYYEILNTFNTLSNPCDYFILNQATSEIMCILTIGVGLSGSFVDSTEYAFSQDDIIIHKMDRTPSTSGGLSDANSFLGMVFTE